MDLTLIIPLVLSLFLVLFFTPIWIRKAKNIGLVWEDMNKKNHPKNVAGSGGIIVVLAFVLGVLSYIAIRTFFLKDTKHTIEIFALLTTILITLMIGFMDDILSWVKGGLSIRFRIFLLIFASIPLVVINAGESSIIGYEIGIIYPLFLIPLGIVGASSTYNFLAGFNGLEASQGIIILCGLTIATYLGGNSWLSLILIIMICCLLGFLLFNKVPARVFPGDGLTYSVGALIAITAILGNMERIAVFFFIPYVLETIFKTRGKLKKQSFGKVNDDGYLEMPYNKIYGLTHLSIYLLKKIKKNVREKDVVYLINLFQIVIVAIGLVWLI